MGISLAIEWSSVSFNNGEETRGCYDALQCRHNKHDGVSNHQPHHCLLNRLFRRRSNKTSKLRVTGFCVGNSPGTGEFPAQMVSDGENVSIWWRHHGQSITPVGTGGCHPCNLQCRQRRRDRHRDKPQSPTIWYLLITIHSPQSFALEIRTSLRIMKDRWRNCPNEVSICGSLLVSKNKKFSLSPGVPK